MADICLKSYVRSLVKNTVKVSAFILSSILISFSSPSFAQGKKCDQLPKVEWWSSTHTKVIATVDKRYQGDWAKYIGRWKSYLTRMEKLYGSDSVAVVKSRGLKLQGKQLADHIKDIQARISVLRCLQKNKAVPVGEPTESELDAMTTASNGPPPKEFQTADVKLVSTQVAAVSGKRLKIEVTAKCDKDAALFQITNLGEKWPRLGEINIYRVNGKSLLSKRRVRMANSQQATFKIRKRGGGSYGNVGIWISPSWEKRAFVYDAKINCS